MSVTLIEVGGVIFRGTDNHEPGFLIVEHEGLLDPPPLRGEEIAKDGEDGIFDTPVERTARYPMWRGFCRAENEAGLLSLHSQFKDILSSGEPGPLTWTEFGVEKVATVRPWGNWRFRRRGATLTATYSIMFRAADPLLYVGGVGSL